MTSKTRVYQGAQEHIDLLVEPVSIFHQGQRPFSNEVRSYDCNLYLLTVIDLLDSFDCWTLHEPRCSSRCVRIAGDSAWLLVQVYRWMRCIAEQESATPYTFRCNIRVPPFMYPIRSVLEEEIR